MKSTLDIGDRSGLMIVLGGVECTITSSNSDIVVVEQVLTFWVAVSKAKGTAEITVSNSIGKRLALTLMVGLTAPTNPIDGDSASLTDNTEIRQKMIRLINQLHMANGVSELPVSEALMNAAQ